ncbi:LPXTG-motif cell wall anchor domain-containing protein [Lentilactobacillus kefiri DSM 20587 = JCM 5818]|uniref:LPXTG-motif cell wall anchor domain-containing protein n=1 Tax=Lentilactobacillus kefiri DSM 20587 = JCM 5818 TaxID=1423764 RepID=A0A8E1RHX0_LENKE|nr:LPXTG-motif cell wall anchor domain-containing protein [Lentilactobacillus parakefiri DSM 10551]KRM49617.1 LPXTG-motif cell wall anchor domain-containing protein [Lentilactobacillus kefiri DSM 20587 = JCM 5818]
MHFIQAIFVAIIFLVIGGTAANADSANLTDGSYTVPITLLKSGSSSQSMANHFFEQTAQVTVSQGNYKTDITTNGANYIASVTMAGQTASPVITSGNNGTLTFNLKNPDSTIPVSFVLYNIPLIGHIQESATFSFSWNDAVKQQGSDTTPSTDTNSDTNSNTNTDQNTTPTASSDSSSATTSTPTSTSSSVTAPVQQPAVTKKSVKTSVPTTTRKYVVLKGHANSKSMANKYFTRTAVIKKIAKHYNVQLKVAYKKNLKLGSKAVRPVTINGRKVKSSVTNYGKTKNYYTMTYSFNVSSFKTLKKIIKGSIHVVVPQAQINTTWPVRFKFSQKAPAKAHKHAAVVASTTNLNSSAKSQAKLPQTGDTQQMSLSLVGLAIASGLSFIWGNNHEISK